MKNSDFIKKLKNLLEENHQEVGDLEFTKGNYDTDGKLIDNAIPTITTDFCEIGCHNDNCYFTVIMHPNSFTETLLSQIKIYDKMHIYGFKNFLEDLYPKRCFSYKEFDEKIKKDDYVQIQFNFESAEPKNSLKKYLSLKEDFIHNNAKVINQITHNFK